MIDTVMIVFKKIINNPVFPQRGAPYHLFLCGGAPGAPIWFHVGVHLDLTLGKGKSVDGVKGLMTFPVFGGWAGS